MSDELEQSIESYVNKMKSIITTKNKEIQILKSIIRKKTQLIEQYEQILFFRSLNEISENKKATGSFFNDPEKQVSED
jgi:hypothetical protein